MDPAFRRFEPSRPSQIMIPIILAAGEGKRFKSKLNIPKVLFPIIGKPMIYYVLKNLKDAEFTRSILVVGYGRGPVISQLDQLQKETGILNKIAVQKRQTGTADAVKNAMPFTSNEDAVMIICGDTPLITPATLKKMKIIFYTTNADIVVLTSVFTDPSGYGRILRDEKGNITKIIEQSDATKEQQSLNEINSGTYIFKKALLDEFLQELKNNNAQGEFYLTDIFEYALLKKYRIAGISADEIEVFGINTRLQLALAQKILLGKKLETLMLSGVTIYDPQNTYIEYDVKIKTDTTILPNTFLQGKTEIGCGCSIGPNTFISNSIISDNTTVKFSYVESSKIDKNVTVGPYSHLRAGTVLHHNVKIGNFVEVKKSEISPFVKAQHLSYLGDISVGDNTNIGAGTITCNYDGFRKNKTVIGKNVFIGSDTIIVAPVEIGDNSITAAGSTITKKVEPKSLAISRSPQVNKLNWVDTWRKSNEDKT